ncbi:MAG: formate dehydrogenase accessory sulfurtransferase FdhD [Acidimicrobiales bacterium]
MSTSRAADRPTPGRPAPAVTSVRAIAVRPGRHVELPEHVATEEPLEIRAAGPRQEPVAVAVTMRTPDHDFELAVGFLATEGLVTPGDVASVGYCETAEADHRWNTVTVRLRRRWQGPERRAFVANSSCGVCGKASIDQVELACPVVAVSGPVPASLVASLPDRLAPAQKVFERTGGLHAAGVFGPDGTAACVREDVGRHNAVDKVVGHGLLHPGHQPSGSLLAVSGRVSFEIVQKAAMAGLGLIAAVSAPSSLAVSAAERLGITLAGFVRGGTYNVYSHPERIDFDR